MAVPGLLPGLLPGLALLLLLLPPPPPGLALPPRNASRPRCLPDEFQCTPGDLCYPREWLCDGHADCEDEGDERGCGTAGPSPGPALTAPRSAAGPPGGAEHAVPRSQRHRKTSATPEPGVSVPSRSQSYMWILIVAGLLSILVAASSVAVWGLFKAKNRSNTISLEKASREQLMPDKSRTGSFP